jgi:hypothetical protein
LKANNQQSKGTKVREKRQKLGNQGKQKCRSIGQTVVDHNNYYVHHQLRPPRKKKLKTRGRITAKLEKRII